jgi:hypothetical protein
MRRDINNIEDWSNDETWRLRRWIVNEPSIAANWHELIEALLSDEMLARDPDELRRHVVSELRHEAELYCCSFAGDLASELIETAMARVNWSELAEELILDQNGTPIDQETQQESKINASQISPGAIATTFFPLGNVVVTPGALARIPLGERLAALARHSATDWGEVDGVDWSENNSAMKFGARIFSEYLANSGQTFLIVTEADRSVTTIMLPDEY